MPSSSKQRAQGGGRKPNSEPKVQVFKEFGGCNFELSPRDFTLGKNVYQEQSDLQMNYVVIQNNAGIDSNKTIETRNNIVELWKAPTGRKFTGVDFLHGNKLVSALDNQTVIYGNLLNKAKTNIGLTNNTGKNHHWKSFEYIDGTLVGMTSENEIWLGDFTNLANSKQIAEPTLMPPVMRNSSGAAVSTGNIQEKGSLRISGIYDANDYPHRISVMWSFVNKFGRTTCCEPVTFYVNTPVKEWNNGCYLNVIGTVPYDDKNNVTAVELFYATGNSSTYIFAARTDSISTHSDMDTPSTHFDGDWSINWFGYIDATNMWPVANLVAPTENTTSGVKASRVTCIDGRLYFWGNNSMPYRLWMGGNPGNLFATIEGVGGGFVDIEPDTGIEVRVVTKYKTQSGASIVTILCDSENSTKEQRYNLVGNNVKLSNEQSMVSWQTEQVAGSVGCKSFRGALVCEDGLYSVSRYGLALTTLTMEYNSQIRTNYVSDAIKPVFTDQNGVKFDNAILLECDGVIYVAFSIGGTDEYDNLLFCYDVDLKAWWTITIPVNKPILDLLHIDYENQREGIGIITEDTVYMLPLTKDDPPTLAADFDTVIQTGELSTLQPQQNWFYLSQLEFRFDYFIGSVLVELTGIDQFGRKVSTKKTFSHSSTQYDLAEYMRVDLRLQSYQIRITGRARFRLTHFMAKLYAMSAKQGLVWGFDDSQSFRSAGDIHPTFLDYNSIRNAIIP